MRLLAIGLVACGSSASPPPPAPPPPPTPIVAPATALRVDRRIETLAIANWLAGAAEYRASAPTPYLADLDRELATLATHPAIVMTRDLHDHHGIAYEQPMVLAIHLDDHLALLPGALEDLRAQDARWRDVDVAAYLGQLQQLAIAAKLDGFFTAHAAYIAACEARFRTALDRENPAPWFADVFGATTAHFTVAPALVQGPWNYGVRFGDQLYQLMGLGVPDGEGLPVVDESVVATLVHEMAHSFINPVFERHLKELEPVAAPLYRLVERDMQALRYGAPKIMLFESGVRAITTLYLRERRGDRAGADANRREVRSGFPWNAELADVFARFHKSKRRDLDAAMPSVTELFTALAKRYEHGLPPTAFLGPIDAVLRSPVLAIVHAPDPAVAKYAIAIQQQLFATSKVEPATLGTFDDLPHAGLLAYGTPASNPVVANILQRAQIKLGAGELELGTKHFTGPHLVLLACWPRADDPSRGVIVYAAASDADVVGINSVHAGGTDWVVARKLDSGTYQTLAAGDFPHAADGAWMLP